MDVGASKYYLADGKLYDNAGRELAIVVDTLGSPYDGVRDRLEAAGLLLPEDELYVLV